MHLVKNSLRRKC